MHRSSSTSFQRGFGGKGRQWERGRKTRPAPQTLLRKRDFKGKLNTNDRTYKPDRACKPEGATHCRPALSWVIGKRQASHLPLRTAAGAEPDAARVERRDLGCLCQPEYEASLSLGTENGQAALRPRESLGASSSPRY